jgi:hypothetical protein
LDSALGLGWEVWLSLSILACLTLFFKFSRFWSVRNLDLLLLFVLVPGMLMVLGKPGNTPASAYIWLFVGSGLWLARCVLDLGLTRRPLLEPNLNASGLLCLSVGLLGLLLAETVSLPVVEGAARNPAEPSGREDRPTAAPGTNNATVQSVIQMAPLPNSLKHELPQVIARRVLAVVAHIALVLGLLGIGWRLFERPITGMAMAACYLVLPYTRMGLVDSGPLVSAALIVAAVFWYTRPALAGVLIGLAAGWIPACLGLIALWCGFYRGRGATRFTLVAAGVVAVCALFARAVPGMGARPGGPEHRRGGPAAPLRAGDGRQLLGQHGLQLPAAGSDRLSAAGHRHDVLAGREEPRRTGRALGGPAGRQPVLVPGQGGRPGDALPAAGDRDDVPADPRYSPSGAHGAAASGQEFVVLSVALIRGTAGLCLPLPVAAREATIGSGIDESGPQ